MDQRREALSQWGIEKLGKTWGIQPDQLRVEMVSGDASFRRYFRVISDNNVTTNQTLKVDRPHSVSTTSWILVDAPPDKEDNAKFVSIAQHWFQHKIPVPAIYSYDFEQGFMLIEDFGDEMLWPVLHQESVGQEQINQEQIVALYKSVIDELLKIQAIDPEPVPDYDAELLQSECDLFTDWLCEKQLQLKLDSDEKECIKRVFEILIDSALDQPQVTVHRDYHSRNLMLRNPVLRESNSSPVDQRTSIGVIDFQDAVNGPFTYDLVSLVRDCYVRWPDEVVDQLIEYFAEKSSICRDNNIDAVEFKRLVDWMGMQRHIKAAGIFARLNLRDGKSGYLKDIPNTCRYLHEISARYPQFAEFTLWLEQVFLPRLQQHFGNSTL